MALGRGIKAIYEVLVCTLHAHSRFEDFIWPISLLTDPFLLLIGDLEVCGMESPESMGGV